MRNQAYRRHHRARMEAHARKVIQNSWGIDDPDEIERFVGCSTDNLQVCSCPDCGNQRNDKWASKVARLTMAERRMEASFRDQMECANEEF